MRIPPVRQSYASTPCPLLIRSASEEGVLLLMQFVIKNLARNIYRIGRIIGGRPGMYEVILPNGIGVYVMIAELDFPCGLIAIRPHRFYRFGCRSITREHQRF